MATGSIRGVDIYSLLVRSASPSDSWALVNNCITFLHLTEHHIYHYFYWVNNILIWQDFPDLQINLFISGHKESLQISAISRQMGGMKVVGAVLRRKLHS